MSSYSNPKISVITVSYNCVNTIEETILSVINQTYTNVEYIIIDGGSNDGTIEIIRKYQDKIAYWVSEADGGIYKAMNKGLFKCTGNWINFMNAGDSFYSVNTIKKVVQNINKIGNVDFVCGIAKYPNGKYWIPVQTDLDLEKICRGSNVNHQASFIKTSLLKEGYDTHYKIVADDLFFIKKIGIEKHLYAPLKLITNNYDNTGISNARENGNIMKLEYLHFLDKYLPYIISIVGKKRSLYKRILNKISININFMYVKIFIERSSK